MKTSHTLSILAATILLGTGAAVYAHQGGGYDGDCAQGQGRMGPAAMMHQGGPMGGPMGHGPGDARHEPGARMAQHLDQVQRDLKLTPQQQPAWDAFRAAMTAQAEGMTAMRDQMQADGKTLPERLTQRQAMMEQGMARMQAMSKTVQDFYAQLTPDQQKIADTLMAGRHGPRFAQR